MSKGTVEGMNQKWEGCKGQKTNGFSDGLAAQVCSPMANGEKTGDSSVRKKCCS